MESTSSEHKLKAALLLIVCLVLGLPLAAQQKVVSGLIEDLEGNPMPGVSVRIEGKGTGTISDVDGKYQLSASEGNTLVFSFIGMKSKMVKVGNDNVINVVLEEDAVMLQEVVAIGYGTKTRATTTGAVDLVNSEKFTNKPLTNTAELLQGVVPGMSVMRSNQGKVGEENYSIQLRGVTSRSDPGILVVVDGIPYKDNDASALNKINPQDIENITILKDAQAAIYGARAAGGVLLVTTKKGRVDKPSISYTGTFNFNTPARVPQKVNVLQHIEMMGELYANDGITDHQFTHLLPYVETADIYSDNPLVVKGAFGDTPDLVLGWHDWWDEMYGTAFEQSHNLSISGGSEKFNYYTSIGYVDQNSMFNYGDHEAKKYWGRFKGEYNLNKFIKLRSNIYVGRKNVVEPYDINQLAWVTYWTWNCQPTYNPQGQYYACGGFGNPIAFAEHTGNAKRTYYSYYTQLGFDITPIKNLTITGDMSLNYDIADTKEYRTRHQTYHWDGTLNYDVIDYWYSGKTKSESKYDRNEHIVTSLHANYDFNIKEDHMFNVMFGASHEELDTRGFNAYRYNINEELPVLGLGDAKEQYNGEWASAWAITSVFGRLSYNWDNRVFVEATYRNDGSSKFAEGHKWEDFWGVSSSWIISNENFFSPAKKWLNTLKLRASWGQLGNQAGIGLYDHYQYISIGGQYPFGNSDSPLISTSATLGGMPAIDRTWETIDSYNFGVDFATLRSRLSGSFDYFIKDNGNMFYAEEYPSVLGTTAPSINGAHVRTNGWELMLNWRDKIHEVGYSIGFTLSDNKTEVISLSDSRNPGQGLNSFVEGYPTNSYFLYDFEGFITDENDLAAYKEQMKNGGVPTNIRVGDAKFADKDGDGVLEPTLYKEGDPNSGDLIYAGNNNQRFWYGINLGLDWKGIDFSAFLQGVGKWQCINGTYAGGGEVWKQASEYFYHNTWAPDRPNAEYPRLTQDGGIHGYNYQMSNAPYKLFNNRYLRLKEIQIGYTLPKTLTKKFGVEVLRVYATGMNLFEFDNLPKGFDPEAPYTENLIPFSRTYSIGVNVQF